MKALVIGGATIDVITSIDTADIECITMKNATNSYLMMEQGKKVEATRVETHIGGGACNAAVTMARMGMDVLSVLKLGTDVEADRVLARLTQEKVDTRYVMKTPEEQTGKSVVVSSHDRNAGIFVHRGANTSLKASEIEPHMFDGVDLVYVSTLSSQSADAFPKIVELAKKAGAYVAANPGIRQLRRRRQQVLDALQYVDLLAINQEEAAALAEGVLDVHDVDAFMEGEAPELLKHGIGENRAKMKLSDLVRFVSEIGCEYLIVTNGAEGAYLANKDAIHFRKSVPCVVESTIGAGDAFNATFVAALVQKKTIWTALSMAAVNGAAVAGSLDTQSGLMTMEALNKRVLSMDSSKVQSYQMKDLNA